MMPLAIVFTAIVIALVRGGSLSNFATLEIRFMWIAFGAFALQLALFNPFNAATVPPSFAPWIYIFSMSALLIWVVVNRQLPGMLLIGIGMLMNTVAITANGGYMPVGLEQARFAGKLANYTAASEAIANNSIVLPRDQTQLWFLTDILALPAGVPLANVFSFGDVLLFLGIGILCYVTMCRRNTRITV